MSIKKATRIIEIKNQLSTIETDSEEAFNEIRKLLKSDKKARHYVKELRKISEETTKREIPVEIIHEKVILSLLTFENLTEKEIELSYFDYDPYLPKILPDEEKKKVINELFEIHKQIINRLNELDFMLMQKTKTLFLGHTALSLELKTLMEDNQWD